MTNNSDSLLFECSQLHLQNLTACPTRVFQEVTMGFVLEYGRVGVFFNKQSGDKDE